MNQSDFNLHCQNLIDEAEKIRNAKQPEYTKLSADVLANFKNSGKNLDVPALYVWSIFMDKQLSSVQAHIKNPNLERAEPIESRYADLYNYVLLGYALFKELEDKDSII